MHKKVWLTIMCTSLTMAIIPAQTPAITVDPIEMHQAGELFTITGEKPDNTSRIGVEIFPFRYWEYACRYGEMTNAKYVRFVVQYLSENLNDAPFVKLVRFNPDKTQSYIEYPNCPDHILTHPSVPANPGSTHWRATIGTTSLGRYLEPGAYRLFAWDGSDQILYSDTYQPNGWDISGSYVYPATMRGNVWDLDNKQKCANQVFFVT